MSLLRMSLSHSARGCRSQQKRADHDVELAQRPKNSAIGWMLSFDWLKFGSYQDRWSWLYGACCVARLLRNLKAQNLMRDTTDINQYKNDQLRHSLKKCVSVSDVAVDGCTHRCECKRRLISHSMVSHCAIEKAAFAQRAIEDILDEDGDVGLMFAGEAFTDDSML